MRITVSNRSRFESYVETLGINWVRAGLMTNEYDILIVDLCSHMELTTHIVQVHGECMICGKESVLSICTCMFVPFVCSDCKGKSYPDRPGIWHHEDQYTAIDYEVRNSAKLPEGAIEPGHRLYVACRMVVPLTSFSSGTWTFVRPL